MLRLRLPLGASLPGRSLPGRRLPRRAFGYRDDVVDQVSWHCRTSLGELPPDAPRIVLVPGLGAGNYLLEHGSRLAADARVLIPDLPGFGRSRAPRRPAGITEWADLLAAWHHVVVGGPAGYVGSSFGAQVVACLAARHPDCLTRAVLVGPTFDSAAPGLATVLSRWVRSSVREPIGLLVPLAVSYLQSGPATPLHGFRAGLHHPTERDVAAARAPLLLVRGEHDHIAPAEWLERLAACARDARLQIVPGVAHTVDFSAPGQLADLVGPFLGGPPRHRHADGPAG